MLSVASSSKIDMKYAVKNMSLLRILILVFLPIYALKID